MVAACYFIGWFTWAFYAASRLANGRGAGCAIALLATFTALLLIGLVQAAFRGALTLPDPLMFIGLGVFMATYVAAGVYIIAAWSVQRKKQ